MLALLCDTESSASKILSSHSVSLAASRALISERLGVGDKTRLSPEDMTPRVRTIIEGSARCAEESQKKLIGTEHILFALLSESDCTACRIISSQGASVSEIHRDILSRRESAERERKKENKKDTVSPLKKYGTDLTAAAREGELSPLIGREAELERMIHILSRKTKNNPCLIGDPGVGKTAIVEGLASRINEGSVPQSILGKSLIKLDLTAMLAGAKYRGEFEDRMKTVLDTARGNRDLIFFIDELHTIIGAGGAEGAIDAANIIKPALARGELRLIGATTTDEYQKHIEHDPALERRFQPLEIREPSKEKTLEILKGLRESYEKHHGVTIEEGALYAAIELSERYITDRFLPDKAIDLIDETAAGVSLSSSGGGVTEKDKLSADKERAILEGRLEDAALIFEREKAEAKKNEAEPPTHLKTVSAEDVSRTLSLVFGIPVLRESEESSLLSSLEERLLGEIIGQDDAVKALALAVKRGRAGLREENRPVGSFIFSGPPGTGKTALARALALAVYSDKDSFIRLDMSEYSESHSVSRLIGAPPGYVGYGDGGILTDKIRKRPYSVVLFDELEKAHPDVSAILLQILEDGVLTDSRGRLCSFKSAIVIMTTNAAIGKSKGSPGFALSASGSTVSSGRWSAAFSPELLDRIDEVIVFKDLSPSALVRITEKELQKAVKRAEKAGITLITDDSLAGHISELAREGEGARPIRRAVIRFLEDPLASMIIESRISNGDTVRVGWDEERKLCAFSKI